MQTETIAQQVRAFVEQNFAFGQTNALADGDSFLDQGIIDSTGILELIQFLQDTYAVRVEDEEAVPDNLDSIEKVSAFVRRKLEGPVALSA